MLMPAIARFGFVGLAQNALGVLVFALAVDQGVDYRVAAVLVAILALLVSFALNRLWTFQETVEGAMAGHAVRYAVVYGLSIALGVVLLTALVELAGFDPVPAQIVAIAVVAPASFLTQRLWVFRPSRG